MNEFLGKFEVNEEDLKKAYKILFNEEGTFDKEKENIIKSFENCCIEAVPGSGKTTTLVAKLIILVEKMRNTPNDKGICVLTHTNVGIDIIKKKLGQKADILFKYPNYVGTLQSFIDKYLAIPNYKIMFKSPIKIIDDDWINKMVKYKISYGLKTIIEKRQIQIDEVFFNFKDNSFYLKSDITKTFLKDNKKENYKILYERINNGEIKYQEALQLGNLYIKNYPVLTKLFSNRFSIVIVDEMQDTNEEAFKILEQLFDKKITIVQYIGDGNQNIMKGTDKWNKALNKLPLSKSKRFGENISDFLNKISKNNEKIIGDVKVKDYKPTLIVYDDLLNITNKNNKIIEKFVEIIKDKRLDKIENPVFKAIGRVGRKNANNRVTISSYFPQYVGSLTEEKNTISFLLNKRNKTKSENKIILKEIRKKIEKFIEKQNIEIGEIDELFDNLEYKSIVYQYFKDRDMKMLLDKIKNYFKNRYNINKFEKEFELIFDFNEENKNSKIENKYIHDTVMVEIDTVHGVKGETHTATLYLETFYRKYDVSSFLNSYLKKVELEDLETKNILYVGSSRAKYLLCLAINKKNIKEFEKNKERLEENFEIHYV